jgi:hypothetical protein
MATEGGPKLITDGLVLMLDAGNSKSYPTTGTTWFDKSGNGYNGTLTNGPTFSSTNGASILFDGVNDYVVINNLTTNGNTNMTLSIWCNHLTNQTGDVVSIIYGLPGTSYACAGLYYRNSSDYVRFTTWQSTPGDYDTSFIKDFNIWHNYTIVYSNNTILIYRDGIPDTNGVKSKTINFTQNKLMIGGTISNGVYSNIMTGLSLMYNRALSAEEILQNYNATKSRFE